MRAPIACTVVVLLGSAGAAAQEQPLPTTKPEPVETSKPEADLTPSPPPAPPVKAYVDELQKLLGPKTEGEPPAETKSPRKPGPKEGPTALGVTQDLLWEEDYDDYMRAQTLKATAARRTLEGGISEAHVVERGDTLWDLSGRFLNNPWMWPRVWSYNPHITNPHWIYPGQVIRFRPPAERPEEAAPTPAKPTREQPKILPGHRGLVAFEHTGYVDKKDLEDVGTLESSPEEKRLLARYDEAYVRFKRGRQVKVGDRFLTLRLDRRVSHPATGKDMGYMVLYTGEVRVTAAGSERKLSTVAIEDSWRSIERGNLVIPWRDLRIAVERRPNKVNLEGVVFAAIQERILGEHQLAFIDRGARQGVEYGNRFVVVRRGDGYLREEEYEGRKKLPLDEIAEIIVLRTRPNTSVGLVRRSTQEVDVGDKAHLRKGD